MKQHCDKTAALQQKPGIGGKPQFFVRCECGFEGSHRMTEDDAIQAYDKLVDATR